MRLGGHAQPVAQHQLRRRGFNKAAITAVGGAGIQRAADINLVVAHVAHQKDAAIFAGGQCLRLTGAAVVDHRLRQIARRLGTHINQPAIGPNRPALADQRVNRSLINLKRHRPAKIQAHPTPRTQSNRAARGGETAGVCDLGRDQCDGAAVLCGDLAGVGDCRSTVAFKPVCRAGFGQAQCRGDKAADIDLRAGAKHNPVGIDQNHPAVGGHLAVDRRSLRAGDPVERGGCGRGLFEGDGVLGPDGKAVPVDI